MTCFYRLFFLLSLIFSVSATAAISPTVTKYRFANTSTGTTFYSFEEGCSALPRLKYPADTSLTSSLSGTVCNIYRANGSWVNSDYLVSVPNQCPQNSAKSGSTCVCNSGFNEVSGQCVLPDPCEELDDYCNSYSNTEREWTIPGASSRPAAVCYKPKSLLAGAGGGYNDRFPGCNRGCNLGTSPGVVKYESNDGQSMITGYGVFSGSSCSLEKEPENPDPEAEETPEAKDPDPTCSKGFKGTVNGVVVCVPPKSSSGVIEKETKDNGDGTQTDSETTVKCEGGTCKITKTSTTTDKTTNSEINSSSVTTTVDKKDFCAQNKSSAQCKDGGDEKGDGKFGGSCDAGFTCEGDALQCAIAKEQHKRSCELHVNESPESKLYEAAKAKTGKATDDLPGNETISLTDRIDTSSALGAGYCPLRDITVDAFGYSKVLPLSDNCEKIGYVKVFFISFCLLLAVWIVFGRK